MPDDAGLRGDSGEENDAGTSLLALMDDAMDQAVDAHATVGTRCPNAMAVVVTTRQTLVRGYGVVATGSTSPPTGSTLFQVGSLTKVLTGLALAQLEQTGQLRGTDTAKAHLAADLADVLPATTPTLHALVSHTAGLPNYPNNLGSADGGINTLSPASEYSREAFRTFLETWTPLSPEFRYSNLGFGLLGVILTDATGAASYHQAMRALVTGPLDMKDTWGQISAVPPSLLSQCAQGHYSNRGWFDGSLADMGVLAGAGEAATTGDDMAKVLRALTGVEVSPLEAAIVHTMAPLATASTGRDVGHALNIEHRVGGDVFSKDGFTQSYSAFLMFSRSPAVGVAVMTGCGKPYPVESVASGLFEQVLATVE